MFRFIKLVLESIIPLSITFYLLPKLWDKVFGKKEVKKKNNLDRVRKTPYTGSITFPTDRPTPKNTEPEKKNNFTKGADPNFL